MEIESQAPIGPGVPPSGNGTSTYRPYQVLISPDDSTLYVTCVGVAGNTTPDFVRVYSARTFRAFSAHSDNTGRG
jgi:hypothetical protein